ncbi:hypothetical protein Tco_0993362 [Tanacetum coccineum]|uniref:Uncharacterized protein n=1 Tax=Tanacetum coccineum TaxID=301880 RepID=A0ABQ5F643_9ASTR
MGVTRPGRAMMSVMVVDLMTMFDPHVKDQVMGESTGLHMLDGKIYESCGVHSLRANICHIPNVSRKEISLTPATITYMLTEALMYRIYQYINENRQKTGKHGHENGEPQEKPKIQSLSQKSQA